MDKKSFKIVVKLGTRILSSSEDYVVDGIPDNALERLEQGANWLVLTPEAHDDLVKLPAEKLEKIIHLRGQQGFSSDVKILEKALKTLKKEVKK